MLALPERLLKVPLKPLRSSVPPARTTVLALERAVADPIRSVPAEIVVVPV